jgi:hypothetical protein
MPLIAHHEYMSAAEFEKLTGMPSDALVLAPAPKPAPTPLSEAALFKRCRRTLGLSLNQMASTLLIAGDRNPGSSPGQALRRWEDDTRPVSGPAWVALGYMLCEAGEDRLADQVAAVVQQRRAESRARQQDPIGHPDSRGSDQWA